jgi:hypothetical protein
MEILEICKRLAYEVKTNLDYFKATKNVVYNASARNIKQLLDDILADEKLAFCECCGEIVPEASLVNTDDFISDGGIGLICDHCYRGLK